MTHPKGTRGTIQCTAMTKDEAAAFDTLRVHAQNEKVEPINLRITARNGTSISLMAEYDASGFPQCGEWLVDPTGQRYFTYGINPLPTNRILGIPEVKDGLVDPRQKPVLVTDNVSKVLREGWKVESA